MGHLTNENTLAFYCIEKNMGMDQPALIYILIGTFVFHLFSTLEIILDIHGSV